MNGGYNDEKVGQGDAAVLSRVDSDDLTASTTH